MIMTNVTMWSDAKGSDGGKHDIFYCNVLFLNVVYTTVVPGS